MADSTPSVADKGTVAVYSRDLFFGMRIRTVLRQLGYQVALTKTADEFNAGLSDGAVLGIVDFNVPVDWSELKAGLDSGVPVIAFGAHTDVDGFRAAKAAGVTRVASNGEFSRSLPDMAAKYARQTTTD